MDIPRNQYGIPSTDGRVPLHTSDRNNARIHEQTQRNLSSFAGASRPQIDERIAALRREWDVERMLEANAATVAMAGLVLGITVDKRFLALPVLVAGFLFQHAVQGWCPPLPVMRRLGVRTSAEIHAEILALRLMRDDFNTPVRDAEHALSLATQ
jgi:hypothetical protein